jgi:hypothetical protein
MASTYSTNLGIELIGAGEQSGTWGTTTNNNLGNLLEQAISGVATYACTGGTDTITLPNGASGTARNMFLELTGTGGGSLVVPANKKLYFIYNNTSSAITVKVSGQTGVSVPAGAKTILVMNSGGTDVVDATNYFSSLTLGAALPVASGGTGVTSTTPYSVYTGNSAGTGFTAIANGTTGQILQATTSGAPVWGSTYAGTVTSVAAITLGTTGTDLSSTVANGTTTPVITLNVPTASATNRGVLSAADWTTFNNKGSGTVTSVTGTAPVVSSGGTTPAISMPAATTSVSGYLTSTDWNTFNSKQPAGSYLVNGGALGTPSSGTVTNLTGTASININGTVGATTKNTGAFTTLSATKATVGDVITFTSGAVGSKTGYLYVDATFIGFGGMPNVGATWGAVTLNSTGVTLYSSDQTKTIILDNAGAAVTGTLSTTGALTYGGVTLSNSVTGTGSMVLSTSPTFTTPILGTPTSGNLANCTFPTLNQNTTGTAANVTGTVAVANGGTGATSATAYAVQCGGTTSTGAHQSVASVGTSGQVLTSNGAAALPTFSEKIVQETAVATTSGTYVDFTGIPSWVKRITVMFDSVSTNGTSNVMVQLGTSSGVEATGYSGAVDFVEDNAGGTAFSTGFLVDKSLLASNVRNGQMIISAFGANKWVESSTLSKDPDALLLGAGVKTLSGTLDRVRITTANGTDTFDSGTVNILYE